MILNDTLYLDLVVDISKEEFDLQYEESIETLEMDLETTYIVNQISGDIYKGTYIVDPSFDEQTFETKNKTMLNDMTVNAIEVSRVSNIQGGTTVYIGGIFDA